MVTGEGERQDVSLSKVAIRSGGYIVRREGIGMVIRLVGVVITVREIGPGPYGIYSAALAFVSVAVIFAQMGIEVYLIRQPGDLGREHYDRAYTFLLCSSTTVMLLCLAGTVVFGQWLRPVGVLLPLRVLLLCVPINVLWAPGQAQIERRFGYRQLGWLEIGGDLVLYGTAVPLAILHAGAWSLVAGYFAWQTFLLVGSLIFSGLRPRWNWSRGVMVAHVRHGAAFSATQWIGQMNGVINALVVGSFFGAVGVGFVSFALRLVDVVGFAARGAYRLGVVAMSRVSDAERGRLRYAIEQGSILQLLALAVPFACFGVAAPWMIPLVFGHEWKAAIPVYSVLALAAVLNAPSLMLGTFLFSRGQNVRAGVGAGIGTVVLAATSVPLVARMGVVGFGWASVIALIDTVYLDRVVRRTTHFSCRMILAFALALSPPILFPLVPLPYALLMLLPLTVLFVIPALRTDTLHTVSVIRSSFARSPT